METSLDDYRVVENKIENAVGKFTQQSAAHIFVDNWILIGIAADRLKTSFDCFDELGDVLGARYLNAIYIRDRIAIYGGFGFEAEFE